MEENTPVPIILDAQHAIATIEIEKGIPIPKKRIYCITDVMRRMEINDSAFFPGVKSSSAGPCARSIGFKFTTRSVIENGVKGVRLWRIA